MHVSALNACVYTVYNMAKKSLYADLDYNIIKWYFLGTCAKPSHSLVQRFVFSLRSDKILHWPPLLEDTSVFRFSLGLHQNTSVDRSRLE